jgi:hypothetical protein
MLEYLVYQCLDLIASVKEVFCILTLNTYLNKYEGESVNCLRMDIRDVIFEPGNKNLFLDTSPTNTDTLVPLLYQCVETHSTEAF